MTPILAGSGAMTEQLLIQEDVPTPIGVSSLTRTGMTASADTAVAHDLMTGDYVAVAGATPAGYNGKVKITVTGATSFAYPVVGTLTTPATGTITAVYVNDAQGGKRQFWRDLATIYGEMIPLGTSERLQRDAVQSSVMYRFRVYLHPEITAKMRAKWTPSWLPSARERLLEIAGDPLPANDRMCMFLELSEAGV